MKNIEVKKLTNEKKMHWRQFVAEAPFRKVYTHQTDDDSLALESLIAPLEDELKRYKNEVGFQI